MKPKILIGSLKPGDFALVDFGNDNFAWVSDDKEFLAEMQKKSGGKVLPMKEVLENFNA